MIGDISGSQSQKGIEGQFYFLPFYTFPTALLKT
jgi:hypothetical protein